MRLFGFRAGSSGLERSPAVWSGKLPAAQFRPRGVALSGSFAFLSSAERFCQTPGGDRGFWRARGSVRGAW